MEDPDRHTPNRSPPLPTHCDAPLTYINVRKALLKPAPHQYISHRNPCRLDWMRIKKRFGLQEPQSWDFSRVLPVLMNELDIQMNPTCLQELKQQTDLAILSAQLQWNTILSNNPGLQSPYHFYDPTHDKESKYMYTIRSFWEEGILTSGSDSYHPRYWWSRTSPQIASFRTKGWLFVMTPNLFAIRTPSNQLILTSRDHALILSDLCSQRYLLKNLCQNATVNGVQSVPPWEVVARLLTIHDDMLKLRGNLIYDVVYTLEPLCVSKVVGDIPCGEDGKSRFADIISREIHAKIGNDPEILALHDERDKLLTEARNNGLSYFFQLYGLYRLWGHPTLEPLKGVIAVKQLATKIRIPNFKRVHQITNKFKEEMIIRYILKNKKWPLLDVTRLSPFNPIRRAYEDHREYPLSDKYYSRDHLSLVSFEAIFAIDPKYDISELLADKAMSLGLTDLMNQILLRHNVGSSLDRSVLIKWMTSDLHDPEEFLRNIDLNGFGQEEKCNGVREKEREGKLKARLFGLMTLLKRMYIVLTEALLAEHVLKFFPEITMTDDELQLEKKRNNFAKESHTQHCINVSLDFAKWNTNMRDSDTRPFFEVLDQMFGFKRMFTRTHEMFEDSVMYLLDGSYLPPTDGVNLLEAIGSWRGHLGGVEGLRQKGWTLWTVNLILCVAENYSFKLKIMGQGDNQLLRLIYPPNLPWEVCQEDYLSFIRDLRDMLNEIGPPLKLEETWASADFYLYGKYPMYKGASYSMSLKKACRAFKNSNEDYPTVESTLSSLSANMFGGLASDVTFKHLYVCYLMEVVGTLQRFFQTSYLQRSPPRSQLIGTLNRLFRGSEGYRELVTDLGRQHLISNQLLFSLILVPRTLGGYPILHLNHCMIKGNPDPLSFDLATIYSLIPLAPRRIRGVLKRALQPLLSISPNYLLLFENPTALNLDSAPTPSEARKQKILEYLTSSPRVTNPALVEFLQLATFEERDKLCQYISHCNPMNPRVMSLFFNSSTTARALKAVNRLNKSPTITALYRQEGEENLYTIIEKAEFKHCLSVLRQLYQLSRGTSPMVSPYCSITQATALRSVGWQREIVGVDCTPPHEVCTIEVIDVRLPCTIHSDWELQAGNITYRITKAMSPKQIKDITLQGPVVAYRGSITRNKVDAMGSTLASKAPPLLQAVCRLVGTRGWTYQKNGNLDTLARALLESKTDLTYDDLIPDDTNIAGSYHHRLRDERVDGGGTSPMLPVLGQRISIDTSPLVYLNKGTTNKNVMFQTLMIYNQTLIAEQLRAGDIPDSRVFHVHLKSLCCIQDIDERPIENQESLPPHIVYRNINSPYLYVKKEKLQRLIQQNKTHLPFGVLSNDEVSLRERFTNLLAEEITYILDPQRWNRQDGDRHLISPVVISWALPCELEKVIYHLSIRLVASLIPPHHLLSRHATLTAIVGKIMSSPNEPWVRLSNLAFSPEVHHRLSLPPISLQGQSEGELTEEAFGQLLKKAVIRYVTCLRDEPAFMLNDITICCRILSPPSMHSMYLAETIEMMRSGRDLYKWKSALQVKSDIIEEDTEAIRAHLTRLQATWGNKIQLTSESLDYLSKSIKPPPPLTQGFSYRPIPTKRTASLLLELHELNMRDSELTVQLLPSPSITTKDFSSFVSKPAASPTTAPYKLLSIMASWDFHQERIENIACLADGAGGFSYSLAKIFPEAVLFHNTLLFAEKSIPQLPPMPFIPAFSGSPWLERRVIGRDITNELPSDITGPAYSDSVSLWVRDSFDLVTGDAEAHSTTDPVACLKIYQGYTTFCEKLRARVGIFKAYSANPSLLTGVLSILMTYFQVVKIYRSEFSTSRNTEIYLVCTAPRPHPVFLLQDGNHLQGRLPSVQFQNLLYSMRDSIMESATDIPLQVVQEYSEWILHPIPLCDLVLELKAIFPWLYSSSRVTIPMDIMFWIRSFHYSSKKKNVPRLGETTRLTFSNAEIKIVILSLLFGALVNIRDQIPQLNLSQFFSKGHLIWYRAENEGWGFTLYYGEQPGSSNLPHIWLYPVADFVTEADQKRLFRMIGIYSLMKDSPEINNPSKTLLTFSHTQWDDLWIPKAWKPKNRWLKKMADLWERSRLPFELARKKKKIVSTLTLWDQKKRLHERCSSTCKR